MKPLKQLIAGAVFVLAMNSVAQAQERVDMSKFTCDELMRGTANAIEAAIWLSGYYNGQRKNTVLDMNRFQQNAQAVIVECGKNPKKTVMQTVNTMLSSGKKK